MFKLKQLWLKIMRFLGASIDEDSFNEKIENKMKYEDTAHVNFTKIFSNKISNFTVVESSASVSYNEAEDYNQRTIDLNRYLKSMWDDIKFLSDRALGTGGVVIIPTIKYNEIDYDIIDHSRLEIHNMVGSRITKATILAEQYLAEDGKTEISEFIKYTVENNNLTIKRVKLTNGMNVEIISENTVSNVNRALFSYFKSPIHSSDTLNPYGMPVMYGCDEIIHQIVECLHSIQDEFNEKSVRIFADDRLFKKDEKGRKTMPSKVFTLLNNVPNEAKMIDTFSPDIRDSSYYNRLQQLYNLLEKQVGTSAGVLTPIQTSNATATEIKQRMFDTFTIVDNLRRNIEQAINDYIYAVNVLLNLITISTNVDYDIKYNWSYSLLENSTETFNQLITAKNDNIISKAEVRVWMTNESLEEAQEAIDKIEEQQPSLATILNRGEA